MKNLVPVIASVTFLASLGPGPSPAAQQCAEVENAKAALSADTRMEPRAAARNQDLQAPRNNDVQSPRSDAVQAPRSQDDVQSPRNQDIQSPRTQQRESEPGTSGAAVGELHQHAAQLVDQAQAACDAGNPTVASQKAREALALLRR